jgi:hypothetical protein
MSTSTSARELLTRLGVGQFNATMVIQFMFIPAATTDPKSPPVMLLVRTIQKRLSDLGYSVPQNGYLGEETAKALDYAVGPGWEKLMWGDVVKGVLTAPAAPRVRARPEQYTSVGALDLPVSPYVAIGAAAAAYYFLIHKKR